MTEALMREFVKEYPNTVYMAGLGDPKPLIRLAGALVQHAIETAPYVDWNKLLHRLDIEAS